MAYRAAVNNFTKGEVSPEVAARFDLAVYSAALRKATNVKIQRTGGVRKRPGTRFVAEALSSASRLFPFQFNDEQAYVLEFSQGTMRPYALGGALLENGQKVTAITKEATAKVTASFHGFKVGDQVYLSGVKGMVEINDRFLTVTQVVDVNNFRVNFNSTNAGTFTGDTAGGIINTAPPPVPPPPPAVPPPPPPPPPADVGGGGGGGYTGGTIDPTPAPTPTPAPWKDDGIRPALP